MTNELFDGVALDFEEGDGWSAAHGDNVELMRSMKQSCVDLTVTSIPFSSLFTYSASDRDAGNVRNDGEFFKQFSFFVTELLRVTKPGRIAAIHCMLLPSSKTRDGFIGLKDFRGDVVWAMQQGGWIFHSETAIRKDPVVAVQRTKALGLLHKQLKKDSCMSRTGIADYLVAFRKPGVNPEPVTHTNESYPVRKWQQVAEPVWIDIDQTETLNGRSAREDADEAHLCCLQTQVIERCVELWSNPGDFVFDPYGGIGSTGVVALEMGRRAAICELKPSYWTQSVANLRNAEPRAAGKQTSLLDLLPAKETTHA
jgi:DNA modification methylase